MAEFLVELFMSRADGGAVRAHAERARTAAEEHTRHGTPVHYLRSVFVPEDETWFLLFEAESAEAVRQAMHGANLRFDRVTEAVQA